MRWLPVATAAILIVYFFGPGRALLISLGGFSICFVWWVAESIAQKRRQREMAFREWLDRCAAIGRQYNVHASDTILWRDFFAHRESPMEAVKKAAELIDEGY